MPSVVPLRALFLFAPKFNQFGIDLAERLVSIGVISRVDGLCTGGAGVVRSVRSGLAELAGEVIDLEMWEQDFISGGVDCRQLLELEGQLLPGAFGRILTADRRVGNGFVTGGRVPPSRMKSAALRMPTTIPELYGAKLIAALLDFLDRTKPDFIFLYANAGAVSVALNEIAQVRNIKVFGLVPARVGSLFTVDTAPLGHLKVLQKLSPSDITKVDKDFAKASLAAFRSAPAAPHYMMLANRGVGLRDGARSIALAAIDTARLLLGWTKNERARRWFSALNRWHQLGDNLRRVTASDRLFLTDFPQNRRVVYFPLHVDPEASTMVLSPYHTNQLAVVEALAKALPAGAVLAVKEHLPMLGRRPAHFYETLAAMPRVHLLSPRMNGLECVRRADVTAVITGTAAWEALRLGRPAVVIGNSPFLQIGEGMLHEPSLANLPDALSRALTLPVASDEALLSFLARLHAGSFELDASLLWGNYWEHEDKKRKTAVADIARRLAQLV